MREKTRLKDEFDRYSLEQPCDLKINPYDWWRENRVRFPLLCLYFHANLSFQGSSTPFKRVFNIDSLVIMK